MLIRPGPPWRPGAAGVTTASDHNLPVEELRLSTRARRCLRRAGIDTLGKLVERTPKDLLSIRGFGQGCLSEVITELRGRQLSLRDPGSARGLGLVSTSTDHRQGPPLPARQPRPTMRVPSEPLVISASSLERAVDELMRWARVPESRRPALAARFGWPDGRRRTLQQAGDMVGLTRERIRQIEARFQRRVRGRLRLPVFERALATVRAMVPTTAEKAASALVEGGLAHGPVHPGALLRLASTVGLEPGLEVVELPPVGEVVVAAGTTGASLRGVASELKRSARPFGFIHLDLARQVVAQALGERRVAAFDVATVGAVALGGGWFYLKTDSREPAVRLLQDMLAVAGGELRADEARDGFARRLRWRASAGHHAQAGWYPSEEALLGLARLKPELFRVEGDRIVSLEPLDWRSRLAGAERVMVEVLHAAPGRVLPRDDFEREVVARGLKANTFGVYSSYSPFVKDLGTGLWGLRGVDPDPFEVERLRRRATRRRRQIAGWRWLPTGALRVEVRLHRRSSLVVGLPNPARPYLSGRSFEVRLPSGERGGKVRIDDGGTSWGYGPALTRLGADEGDLIFADFDLASKVVVISLATSDGGSDA
jgi:hypothetical protein